MNHQNDDQKRAESLLDHLRGGKAATRDDQFLDELTSKPESGTGRSGKYASDAGLAKIVGKTPGPQIGGKQPRKGG